MRNHRLGLATVALVLVGAARVAAGDDPALERRVWLDVENEDLRSVVATLGSMIDPEKQIAEAVTGRVTARLENVTLRTALNAVCESAGCAWAVVGEGRGRLRFSPTPAPPTPAPIDPGSTPVSLMFQDAQLSDVLAALARMAGLKLVADPALRSERVTLQLLDARLNDVLDVACKIQACHWEIAGGELRIEANR